MDTIKNKLLKGIECDEQYWMQSLVTDETINKKAFLNSINNYPITNEK